MLRLVGLDAFINEPLVKNLYWSFWEHLCSLFDPLRTHEAWPTKFGRQCFLLQASESDWKWPLRASEGASTISAESGSCSKKAFRVHGTQESSFIEFWSATGNNRGALIVRIVFGGVFYTIVMIRIPKIVLVVILAPILCATLNSQPPAVISSLRFEPETLKTYKP